MAITQLSDSVLYRLSCEATLSIFGQAERFEAAMRPDCCAVLSNEPAADWNVVFAGTGASATDHFAEIGNSCVLRNLPFMAIIFPQAGLGVERTAADLGLAHVVDFPMMVRGEEPVEPRGNENVVVRRVSRAEGAAANARVLSSAYLVEQELVRRVMPDKLTESPSVDTFLATINDAPVGAVTVTHHGDTSGFWAMGTDSSKQKCGIGRRLMSTVMSEMRAMGTRQFFLGATPAGYRLYDSLGYKTRAVTKVWVSGETHQS